MVPNGRYVTIQLAEVAASDTLFAQILVLLQPCPHQKKCYKALDYERCSSANDIRLGRGRILP
jgi:hypothetical protein